MKRAFFFDRDGILNQTLLEKNPNGAYNRWPINVDELILTPHAKSIVDRVNKLGYIPIVVTNQRGIYEGKMTLQDYENITNKLCLNLGLERAQIFECLHKNDGECACRKPKPGLFLMARGLYDLDLSTSWMIGDSCSDIEAAKNSGIENTIFLRIPTLDGIRIGNEKEENEIKKKGLNATYKINNLIELIYLI